MDYTITAHFTREIQVYNVTFTPADGTSGTVSVDGSPIYTPVTVTAEYGTRITTSGHEVVLGNEDHSAV